MTNREDCGKCYACLNDAGTCHTWPIMGNPGCEDCDPEYRNDTMYMCINGEMYGPCESEYCQGWCEASWYRCECTCHVE